MDAQATPEILRVLNEIPDPRRHNHLHKLHDILSIALMAVISGCAGWVDVEEFAIVRHDWLKTFLDLPNGIPSHDTFGRVFARLDPNAFEAVLLKWTGNLVDLSGGKLVAIDGKSIRPPLPAVSRTPGTRPAWRTSSRPSCRPIVCVWCR